VQTISFALISLGEATYWPTKIIIFKVGQSDTGELALFSFSEQDFY
jgi:hypothetical protein